MSRPDDSAVETGPYNTNIHNECTESIVLYCITYFLTVGLQKRYTNT